MIHMWWHLKHIRINLALFLACCLIGMTGTACGTAKINVNEESEKILNTYFIYGDIDTTIRKLEELLEQVEKQEGDNSKDEIIAMLSLGSVFCALHEYDKAEPYIQEAKTISDKIMLDEPPIQTIYNGLAQLTNAKGNYEQGIEYSKEALMWNEKIYGKESWQASYVNFQMGNSYFNLNRLEEAEACLLKGLDAEYDGVQEMAYISGYFSLGEIKLKQKKYEEALEMFEEAKLKYGSITNGRVTKELDLTLLLPIYSNMADAYIGLGKYEDAMYTVLRGYGYIVNEQDYIELKTESKEEYINKIFDIWKVINNNESRSEFDSWLADDAMY